MIKDSYGSSLEFRDGSVYLSIINQRTRCICTYDKPNRRFVTNRVYSKHLFRNANAFGFNFELLNRSTSHFDTILILTDKGEVFDVPIKIILSDGETHHFKKQGFEKQIFLGLHIIKKYITKLS